MADGSIISELFDEFEREPEPSDRILKQTVLKLDTAFENEEVETISSGDNSRSSDNDSDSDFIENPDSDHGGGITGVSETLHSITGQSTLTKDQLQDKCIKEKEYLENDTLKKRIEELTKEKSEHLALKRQNKVITVDKICVENEGPAIQVVYMNNHLARKYKSDIEDYIYNLLQKDSNEDLRPLQLRATSVCLSNHTEKVNLPKEKIRQIDYKTAISCGHYYKSFVLDAMGWPLVEYNPSLTDSWNAPIYEQVYTQSIPCDETEDNLKPEKPKRAKPSCFNCGGDHQMRECKEKRNDKAIAKNRREFMATNSPANPGLKMQRYIVKDKNEKRDKFQPGEISEDLRQALGITSEQLPPFIYQMRLFGYPPGWLEEAEVFTSGVAMFDKHGNDVSIDNLSSEEGEIELNLKGPEQKKFNFELLVDYPGFNVEPKDGTIDDWKSLNMPPMTPQHSKEALQLYLEPANTTPKVSYMSRKRRSDAAPEDCPDSGKRHKQDTSNNMDLTNSADESDVNQDCSQSPNTFLAKSKELTSVDADKVQQINHSGDISAETDSDTAVKVDACYQEDGEIVEDFIPPVPPTPELPPLPTDTPPVTPQSFCSTPKAANSDVVAQLFKTPLPLSPNLTSLTTPIDKAFQSDTSQDLTSGADQLNETKGNEVQTPVKAANVEVTTSTPNHTSVSYGLIAVSPNSSGSVASVLGTPVLDMSSTSGNAKNSSIGKGLPDASSFALGITEHLPFENLPKSTGKYQQMKKVLDKSKHKK